MIITVVCDVLGEKNNGTSMAAYNLIDSLKAKGHTVRVVCGDEDKRGLEGYYILPHKSFGKFLDKYIEKNGVHLSKPDKKIIDEACHDADAIHAMFPFPVGKAAVKYAYKHNIPVTGGFHCQSENFTSHIFCLRNKFVNWLVYKNYNKKFYKYVGGTHFPTQFIKDLSSKYGITGGHGYAISNGVKLDQFYPHKVERKEEWKNKYVITMTGRYSKEKWQKTLVDAVKYSKYKDKIQLVFAGSGPLKGKLSKRCEKNGVKAYFDSFSQCELSDVLCQSDLYVHTSYAEIEAISCLEAIACGLVPVISNSKKSATSKFALSKYNLFEFNNPQSLAKRIDYWIENPEAKEAIAKEYKEFVKQFDFNLCMDQMEEMILDNIEETKKQQLKIV